MRRGSITVEDGKSFAPPSRVGRPLKRFVAIAAASALALGAVIALALAVGSLTWHPLRRSGPAHVGGVRKGAGPLLAGVGVRELDVPAPAPVGGFARLHWSEEGAREPVAARALVLQE